MELSHTSPTPAPPGPATVDWAQLLVGLIPTQRHLTVYDLPHFDAPNGRCRVCGLEIGGSRRWRWHPECLALFKELSDTPARQISRQAKGQCQMCGLDVWGLTRNINRIYSTMTPEDRAGSYIRRQESPHRLAVMALLQLHNYSQVHKLAGSCKLNRRLWDADHIVPVAAGGGCVGASGYRLLCLPCHRKRSGEVATRKARARAVTLKLEAAGERIARVLGARQ